MISIVEGPTRLRLSGEDREIKAVHYKLRYHPKGYFHSPRYKAYELTDGNDGWDGYISPIRLLDIGRADCLRGHKDKLIQTARNLDILVNTKECLLSPFENIVADDLPDDLIQADFPLDEYQRESIAFWLRHGMGVNKIAVNGGKTAMFSAVAAMIKRRYGDEARFLYIADRERLVRQAYQEITKFLPDWHITQYGGSKGDNTGKDMVISTAAMLWKHFAKLSNTEWFSSFIGVLYDESHHACSKTSTAVLMKLPCFFRLGASDTRRENDPDSMARIQGLLGPVRYTVPVGVYIDMGRSAKPKIYIVENPLWKNRFAGMPHQAEPGSPGYALIGSEWKKGTYVGPVYELDKNGDIKTQKKRVLEDEVDEGETITEQGDTEKVKVARWREVEVPVTIDGYHTFKFADEESVYEIESTYCLLERLNDRALVRFRERNDLIVDWTRYYSVIRNLTTLVVCTRTMHIYMLEGLLKAAIGKDRVRILLGEHTPKQRDECFDWFRHTPGGVLISPLVQEGVSINEIRAGVIADYVGDWERANQIIGRFIRKKKTDNEAHITWIFDNQHDVLRRGCKRVFDKLFNIRGYTFVHPLLGPDTISQAKVYENLSEAPR